MELKRMVNITIDGKKLEVEEGTTILQAAEKLGIKIPTLCYYKALSPQGACRLCVVEIVGGPRKGLSASCSYVVEEELEVKTNSERVIKARKLVIELLLLRCPDVPKIKELAEEIGIDSSRYERFQPEEEKCILCGMCVRVCQELMGVGAINFINRGSIRRVSPPFGEHSSICVTCGACEVVCPTGAINLEEITKNKPRPISSVFDAGLVSRPSIYSPFPQAVPRTPVIDRTTCMHFLNDACKACESFCEAKAINYEQKDEIREVDVGSIILAPGFDEFDVEPESLSQCGYTSLISQYGYGKYSNVVTSIEFERILSASGPYEGHLSRPSDRKPPRKIAWIQCVGSRDVTCQSGYCSSVCCMYAIKEAVIAKEHSPTPLDVSVFYMDMRTYGKDFDKYYERAKNEYGIEFIRSKVYGVEELNGTGNLSLRYATENGEIRSDEFDMVVLSVGMKPRPAVVELAKRLGIELDDYGFCKTDNFSPVNTSKQGIYVCGAFQGPKDIPETVMQASGAAAASAALLSESRGELVKKKEFPPERNIAGEPPRIGVFVCHCGINIGGVVNVPEVKEYAATLPNVVFADKNLYTCSQDTQELIKEKIAKHRLNRVVVASCTPRTHEPLFQETIQEQGLNKYLFEMANIRDQCSWVHQHQPEMATQKAKDLVRMAVAKASLIEPLKLISLKTIPYALVIGGGISGMVSALNLADQGFEVHLLEKAMNLGGVARKIYYTLEGGDVQAYLKELIEKVTHHPLIKVYTRAAIAESSGYIGNFITKIKEGSKKELTEIKHGVVIIATGGEEYKTTEYFYKKNSRVLSLLELENEIVKGTKRIKECQNLVLIQCVGSRDEQRPYCSRVCCSESIKCALLLKEINPEVNIYILYRDIRTYGLKEDFYRKVREKGIIFIHYEPDAKPEVVPVKEGGKDVLRVTVKEPLLGEQLIIDADILALAMAAIPSSTNKDLSQLFKIPLNEDKFFLEAHMKLRPVEFATDGVFMCGLAHSPKLIEESIAQSLAAASRAGTVLSKEIVQLPGIISFVNKNKCAGCGECESVCPFGAVTLDAEQMVAVVNDALCKGCGVCAASCKSGAINLYGFSNSQVISMIDSLSA